MRAIAIVLLLAAAGPASAASLRGRVEVQLPLRAPAPRPDVAALGGSTAPDVPDRRQSVVYLETAPQGAFEARERPPARLDQRHEAFFPYVLPVLVGTTVEFPNDDSTYHNVFSFSKTQRFDLGRYPRGQSKSVRFDRAGIVRVFCDIHAHMSAWILVFAHSYFATTAPDGRWHIDGVPPGTYRVAVWTDGEVRESREVVVPAGEAAVDVDFAVR
jgi:plastocyanin